MVVGRLGQHGVRVLIRAVVVVQPLVPGAVLTPARRTVALTVSELIQRYRRVTKMWYVPFMEDGLTGARGVPAHSPVAQVNSYRTFFKMKLQFSIWLTVQPRHRLLVQFTKFFKL